MSDRHRLLALAVGGVLLVLVGNLAPGALAIGGASPSTAPSEAPSLLANSDPTPRIAIVYDAAGRGSAGSLNELAWQGAKRAGDRFSAELKEVTSQPGDTDADREARLEALAAAGYDPIFILGGGYSKAVEAVAPKHRQIWFGLVDDGSVDAPNVIGILFNEEQGAYLVGAAAALTSKAGRIGFIGEARTPLIAKDEAGFAAGAKAAAPKVRISVTYLASPGEAAARAAALRLNTAGVDVVFAPGEDAGRGAILAADARGFWAIGSETDQYLAADPAVRDAILTSALKRVDAATFTVTNEVATGVPKDGNNVFGAGRGAIGYATSGGFVDPLVPKLDAFAAKIASGEILVPTKP